MYNQYPIPSKHPRSPLDPWLTPSIIQLLIKKISIQPVCHTEPIMCFESCWVLSTVRHLCFLEVFVRQKGRGGQLAWVKLFCIGVRCCWNFLHSDSFSKQLKTAQKQFPAHEYIIVWVRKIMLNSKTNLTLQSIELPNCPIIGISIHAFVTTWYSHSPLFRTKFHSTLGIDKSID